ncbi:DUF1127 domain-containing protein [Ruegeria sp. 2012CJ15-1]
MHFLHSGIDGTSYCASAAITYVQPQQRGTILAHRNKIWTNKMAATNDFTATNGLEISGFYAGLEALKARFANYRLYRQTVSELSDLSDRDLADLGINRSMIRRVAMEATYDNRAA